MSVYYLARGETVSGPFGAGRIRDMLATGEASAEDQVTEAGKEEWFPADLLAESIAVPALLPVPDPVRVPANPVATGAARKESPPKMAKRTKKRTGAMVAGSFLLGIVGLVLLISAFWWVGLILIVIGAMIDRPHFVCGECGNRVEKTSTMCPTCRARLG